MARIGKRAAETGIDHVDTAMKDDENTDADIVAEVAADTDAMTEIAGPGIAADQETGAAGQTRDRAEKGAEVVEEAISTVGTEAETEEGLAQENIVNARRARKENTTTNFEDTLGIAPN